MKWIITQNKQHMLQCNSLANISIKDGCPYCIVASIEGYKEFFLGTYYDKGQTYKVFNDIREFIKKDDIDDAFTLEYEMPKDETKK